MADCVACGHELPWSHRYCGHCGSPSSGQGGLVSVEDVGVLAQSASSSPPLDWRRVAPAIGGLALLAIIGWSLLGPTEDTGPDAGSREPAGTTTAPPSGGAEVPGLQQGSPGPTTTTTDLPALSTRPRPTSETGEAVLGRPVGFSLVVGSESGPLRRLDLDLGQWTDYEATGSPVLSTGEWLLLSRIEGRVTHAVALDDPDREERALGSVDDWPLIVSAGPRPGQVWTLMVDRPGQFRWQLVDLDDGTISQTISADFPAWTVVDASPSTFLSATPELTTSAAGGVYTYDGERYRKVFDGALVGVANDEILAQTCSLPTICTLHWLARDDFTPIERFLPPWPVAQLRFLSPGGRLLGFISTEGHSYVVDLEREVTIPFAAVVDVVVSPDERYVADELAGGFAVIDLDTGDEFRIAAAGGSRQQGLFVDN